MYIYWFSLLLKYAFSSHNKPTKASVRDSTGCLLRAALLVFYYKGCRHTETLTLPVSPVDRM